MTDLEDLHMGHVSSLALNRMAITAKIYLYCLTNANRSVLARATDL